MCLDERRTGHMRSEVQCRCRAGTRAQAHLIMQHVDVRSPEAGGAFGSLTDHMQESGECGESGECDISDPRLWGQGVVRRGEDGGSWL